MLPEKGTVFWPDFIASFRHLVAEGVGSHETGKVGLCRNGKAPAAPLLSSRSFNCLKGTDNVQGYPRCIGFAIPFSILSLY
jgi:hypothetical protein